MRIGFIAASLTAIVLAQGAEAVQAPAPITAAEKAAGWRHLFYGTDLDAWRGYKQDAVPENWAVGLGYVLSTTGDGADLITKEQYGDFELQLDWKSSEGGNSGIMYRVAETLDAAWQTGPEYQLLDDAGHHLDATDPHSTGALYDLVSPAAGKALNPVGEWNRARIRVKDGLVQHWLNDVKVLECRIDDDAWKEKIAASKFKDYEGFGVQKRGHIALQAHGSPMVFTNIRIRDLDKPMPGEIKLCDGKTLEGWRFVAEGSPMENTWAVKNGVLECTGAPNGYLRTEKEYTSYVLKLEWRYADKPGNSGVLLRVAGEEKVWPRCLEAQLMAEHAGDIIGIGNYPFIGDVDRTQGIRCAHTHMAERPIGQWNDYEIILDGQNLRLFVNGDPVNSAAGVEVQQGAIAVQSEGVPIEFRNIRLAPIE